MRTQHLSSIRSISMSLFTLIVMGFTLPADHVIQENGIEGIVLQESRLKDIRKQFPTGNVIVNKYTYPRGFAMNQDHVCTPIKGRGIKIKHIRYSVQDQGLEFDLGRGKRLQEITFTKGTSYKTDKGIMVSLSTFSDLEKLYGSATWEMHHQFCKIVNTLRFYPADSLRHLTKEELEQLDLTQLTIEKMVLSK